MRQAIRYAIDVPSILKAAYLGLADQENTADSSGPGRLLEDAPMYQRDVAKAKEFMAKAGLTTLDLGWISRTPLNTVPGPRSPNRT